MKDLQSILQSIGLNHFETTIYLQLLNGGEQSASVIARTTNTPRSTTRGVLDKLCERGIVGKLYKRNTQFYSAKSPQSLLQFMQRTIEEKQENITKIQEILPILTSIHQRRNIAPKVQFFEGRDQVIEAFNRCLFVENIKELLIFTSYEFLKDPAIRKNDDDFFIKMRMKKGIFARVLVGKTDEKGKNVNKPNEMRERRFIPKKYSLPGNIHIYGDTVLYFSIREKTHIAVLLEDPMMADTMKSLFEFMWENCE